MTPRRAILQRILGLQGEETKWFSAIASKLNQLQAPFLSSLLLTRPTVDSREAARTRALELVRSRVAAGGAVETRPQRRTRV